jgi:hypothetical protein
VNERRRVHDGVRLEFLDEEVLVVAWLMASGVKYVQSPINGSPAPPLEAVALHRAALRAAELYRQRMFDVAPTPRTSEPPEASSEQDIDDGPDEITAREAAHLLNYSETHVRRIRDRLGLVPDRRQYMFYRATVLAYKASRPGRTAA